MFVGVVAGAVLVNVAPLANSLHVVAPPHRPNSSSRAEERGSAGTPGRRAGLLRRARASMTELVALAPESDHYAPHRRARLPAAEQTVSVESLDSLMFHICLVMLVMFCGYLLRVPIVLLELAFPAGTSLPPPPSLSASLSASLSLPLSLPLSLSLSLSLSFSLALSLAFSLSLSE